MRSKLNEINISLDAATAETYARIRGADFAKVLANVAALVRARRKAGRDDLVVMLNMTLMRANIEELPDFVRLAKRLAADAVAFWRLNDGENYQRPEWVVDKDDWRFTYRDEGPKRYPNLFNSKIREAMRVGEQIGMRIQEDVIKGHLIDGEGRREDAFYEPTVYTASESLIDANGGLAVIGSSANSCATMCSPPPPVDVVEHGSTARRHDAVGERPAPKSATIGECEAPWRWLVVNERGDCLPCCHAQIVVGNLNDSSVDEIWNGQMMQEVRSSIANGEVHHVCQGASCKYVRGNVA
jgi:MoaA/NifB/PqqE/SkfB family radical SAM enzyme